MPADPHFSSNWRSSSSSPPNQQQKNTCAGAIQHVKTVQRSNNTSKNEADDFDRLTRERRALLHSGAYSQDDALIKELDRQIDDITRRQEQQDKLLLLS